MAAGAIKSFLFATSRSISGLVVCEKRGKKVENSEIQVRGEIKVYMGEEESKSEEYRNVGNIVKFLIKELAEVLPEAPIVVLPKAEKIISVHPTPSFAPLEVPTQALTPTQIMSFLDTPQQDDFTVFEDQKTLDETHNFSFLNQSSADHDSPRQTQDGLFLGEFSIEEVEEKTEENERRETEEDKREKAGQDLDLVPKKPMGKPPIYRRVSESILTKVSRKPPVYPKQPTAPKPAFTRRIGKSSSSLQRTKSMKSLSYEGEICDNAPNAGVFAMTHTQLEQYALEYHRPRRTGLMYNFTED